MSSCNNNDNAVGQGGSSSAMVDAPEPSTITRNDSNHRKRPHNRATDSGTDHDNDQPSRSSVRKSSTDEYSLEALANSVHGATYQIKHYALVILRAWELGYDHFKLGKEMKECGKFDDLVLEYEDKSSGKPIYEFVQCKHQAPGKKKSNLIEASHLLDVKGGHWSVFKYFQSYREIQKCDKFPNSISKKYILCTNRGMTDIETLQKGGVNVELATDHDTNTMLEIINDRAEGRPRCYKLKAHSEDNSRLYDLLKSESDIYCLAESLAKCVCTKRTSLLSDYPIFEKYHKFLTSEIIVVNTNKKQKKTMRFKDDFIDPAKRIKLTEEAKKFDGIFWSCVKKSTQYNGAEDKDGFISKLQESVFKVPEKFGTANATTSPDSVIKDEDITNFFERFIIAVDQPNDGQLAEVLKRKMAKQFNLEVNFIPNHFENVIMDWFKKPETCGEFITEREAEEMFEGIRVEISTVKSTVPTLENKRELDNYNIEYQPVNDELESFLGSESESGKVLEISSSTDTLLLALRVHQTIKTVGGYEKDNSYIWIKSEKLKQKDTGAYVSRAFQRRDHRCLLVVDCGTDGEQETTQSLLYSLINSVEDKVKKLLFISKGTGVLTVSTDKISFTNSSSESRKISVKCVRIMLDDTITFEKLSSQSQGIVLNKPIKFQGSTELTTLSELFEIDVRRDLGHKELVNLSKVINSDTLVHLIHADEGNPMRVGSKDDGWETIKDYYIPQKLIRYETIDSGVFRDSKIKDHFAITGINKKKLRELMDNEQGLRYEGTTASMDLTNCDFLRDEQPAHHFENLCKKYLEVVEFLVEKGADVNSEDGNKWTPLYVADFLPNNLEVVEFLVEKGAHISPSYLPD